MLRFTDMKLSVAGADRNPAQADALNLTIKTDHLAGLGLVTGENDLVAWLEVHLLLPFREKVGLLGFQVLGELLLNLKRHLPAPSDVFAHQRFLNVKGLSNSALLES